MGSSWIRDWTHVSCIGSRVLTTEPPEALLLRSTRTKAMGSSHLPICSRMLPSPSCPLVLHLEGPAYPIQKSRSLLPFFFFGADLAGGRIPKNSAQQSWWQSCRRLGSFLFPEGQLTSPPQLGENIEPFTATQGQPFSPRDNQEFTGTRFSFFSHRSDRFIRLWLKKERFCWIWIHQTELQRHEEVEIGLRSSGTQKGWCVSRYGLNHEFVQEVQD